MRITIAAVIGVLVSAPAVAKKQQQIEDPVAGGCISSPFGPRLIPNRPQAGSYHNGVDLPAPEGTPVRAAGSGKLLRIQRHGPGGLEILVQHDGFIGIYSHLAAISPLLVTGMTVAAGQQLGVVGHTGVTFGPHLFFGVLEAGHAVDPGPLLGVPLCKGAKTHSTAAQILEHGGKLPPTRHYLMFNWTPYDRSGFTE